MHVVGYRSISSKEQPPTVGTNYPIFNPHDPLRTRLEPHPPSEPFEPIMHQHLLGQEQQIQGSKVHRRSEQEPQWHPSSQSHFPPASVPNTQSQYPSSFPGPQFQPSSQLLPSQNPYPGQSQASNYPNSGRPMPPDPNHLKIPYSAAPPSVQPAQSEAFSSPPHPVPPINNPSEVPSPQTSKPFPQAQPLLQPSNAQSKPLPQASKVSEPYPLLPPSTFMTKLDGTPLEQETAMSDVASQASEVSSEEIMSPADELVYIKEQLKEYKEAKEKLK